ncbi:MAG: DUF1501 domain-containing protein [Planctomycetales bacterium]
MRSVPITRRAALVASGCGLAEWWGAPHAVAAESTVPGPAATARSTILFFLCGGASHIDTWDMKPHAPSEIRGEFQPIDTAAPGVRLCEHLPLLARQAQHLAVVNSVDGSDPTNSHLAYYYHLTGHTLDASFVALGGNRRQQPDDWPFMGSVVGSRLPPHPDLPNAISLPWIPEGPPDIRAGQHAGRLGVEHDPLYVLGSQEQPLRFQAPALVLEGPLTPARVDDRRELLATLDRSRGELERFAATQAWRRHQTRAFSLLTSSRTLRAFDVASEPAALRARYGETANGMSLLLARRLVEAQVPFVTVFWMPNKKAAEEHKCSSAGGWDTHGNNFHCLKNLLLPEFDRGFSALLEDLADRALLDTTLLLVTSEMGRQPKIGDPRTGGAAGAGRDHWTYCLTDLFAGGGIRGGRTFGASDRQGAYPSDRRVTPADITKTVYRAMGLHDLSAVDNQNRPYHLLEEGTAINDLFA